MAPAHAIIGYHCSDIVASDFERLARALAMVFHALSEKFPGTVVAVGSESPVTRTILGPSA